VVAEKVRRRISVVWYPNADSGIGGLAKVSRHLRRSQVRKSENPACRSFASGRLLQVHGAEPYRRSGTHEFRGLAECQTEVWEWASKGRLQVIEFPGTDRERRAA
jgi:hypothetical protein